MRLRDFQESRECSVECSLGYGRGYGGGVCGVDIDDVEDPFFCFLHECKDGVENTVLSGCGFTDGFDSGFECRYLRI